MYFAFWIWCKGSAGGGVIERERLRCWRFRLPFLASGVTEVPIICISESESSDSATESILQYEAINEMARSIVRAITYRATRTLSFCHKGGVESFFFFLCLFRNTSLSLSLALSIVPVLGTSENFHISVLD